jgi:hypothetical protein
MGADIQIQVASKPISVREGERIELKGEHFRRTEYLNGRVEEVKLFEVNFTQESYRHIEIWREFELPRAPRHRVPICRNDPQYRTKVTLGPVAAPSLSVPRAGLEDLSDFVAPQRDATATTGARRQQARKPSDQRSQELVRIKKEVTIKGITVLMEQTVVSDHGFELTGEEPVVSQRPLEIRGASLEDRRRADADDSFEMSVKEAYALLEPMLGISRASTIGTPQNLIEEKSVTVALSEVDSEREALRERLQESHAVSELISDLSVHEITVPIPQFDTVRHFNEQMITALFDEQQVAKLEVLPVGIELPMSGERLHERERSEASTHEHEVTQHIDSLPIGAYNEIEKLAQHESLEAQTISSFNNGIDRESEPLREASSAAAQIQEDSVLIEELVASRQSKLLEPTALADCISSVEATAIQESASSALRRSVYETALESFSIVEEGVLEAECMLESQRSSSWEMPPSQTFQDLINEALQIRASLFKKHVEIDEILQIAA